MKLAKATRTLLELVAPDWMKKLDKVDWNAIMLKIVDRSSLSGRTALCFMGEIYCYTAAYTSGQNKRCDVCRDFCGNIPNILEYGVENEKKEIMQKLAVHLRKEHKDIIQHKKEGKD